MEETFVDEHGGQIGVQVRDVRRKPEIVEHPLRGFLIRESAASQSDELDSYVDTHQHKGYDRQPLRGIIDPDGQEDEHGFGRLKKTGQAKSSGGNIEGW